jgi:putative cardiolipin synthase
VGELARRRVGWCAAVALLAGCAASPPPIARPSSRAFTDTDGTQLGRLCAPAVADHAGASGFLPLDDGREGMDARIALSDLAERSIDIQTFVWADDAVAGLLWQHLVRAAERGVRVRILVDGFGLRDGRLAALTHENVEVRVFNPSPHGRLGRLVELLSRFDLLNHRMHNKMLLVDGQVIIVGGRNVADEYFGVSRRRNVRDLDLLGIGPVVAQGAQAFDSYWSSEWSTPTTEIGGPSLRDREREARAWEASLPLRVAAWPWPLDDGIATAAARVRAMRDALCWGPAQLYWDEPERKVGDFSNSDESLPLAALRVLTDGAVSELVIEASYFVPHPDLLGLREARARGVDVALLTNSLASTDHVAVHAAYARSRFALLRLGVRLYEARPDAAAKLRYVAPAVRAAPFGLHAKAAVFDRSVVAIGSFNLDPRSAHLDTEVLLVVRCPSLAQWVLRLLARDFADDSTWRVTPTSHDGVAFIIRQGDRYRVSGFEPASLGRTIQELLLLLLPIGGLT